MRALLVIALAVGCAHGKTIQELKDSGCLCAGHREDLIAYKPPGPIFLTSVDTATGVHAGTESSVHYMYKGTNYQVGDWVGAFAPSCCTGVTRASGNAFNTKPVKTSLRPEHFALHFLTFLRFRKRAVLIAVYCFQDRMQHRRRDVGRTDPAEHRRGRV